MRNRWWHVKIATVTSGQCVEAFIFKISPYFIVVVVTAKAVGDCRCG